MIRKLNRRAALVVALAGIAGIALSNGAFAQNLSNAQMQAVRAACEADIRTACPGVQPGGGRIVTCLKANQSKISPPCMDALAAAKAAQ